MTTKTPDQDRSRGTPSLFESEAEREAYRRGLETSEGYGRGWDAAFMMIGKGATSLRPAAGLPVGHEVLEQADMPDGRVSQTVRTPSGNEYLRVVHADEAYGPEDESGDEKAAPDEVTRLSEDLRKAQEDAIKFYLRCDRAARHFQDNEPEKAYKVIMGEPGESDLVRRMAAVLAALEGSGA